MKKISILLYISVVTLSCYATSSNEIEDKKNDCKMREVLPESEFLSLSDPEMKISGAYYGIGLAIARISNNITLKKDNDRHTSKESATQFDFSIIAGFGGNFYNRYYAGVELETFKRFHEKEKSKVNIGEYSISTVFGAISGINMDIRFGYQFPKYRTLPYFTFGFSKMRGSILLYKNSDEKPVRKQSFGSFYPTVGFGVEHKLNHKWNLRGDCRVSISSKDDSKKIGNYSLEGKPSKISFRLAVTRNI